MVLHENRHTETMKNVEGTEGSVFTHGEVIFGQVHEKKNRS